MTARNGSIHLKDYLTSGFPDADRDFEYVQCPELEALEDGEIAVQLLYISVDPFLRGRMEGKMTYVPGFKKGEPITGFCVASVLESKNSKYETGDALAGMMPWTLRMKFTPDEKDVFLRKISKADLEKLPVSYHASALGMPGMTAWFGFVRLCEPKEGETLVVSAAAGAVGQLVGQLGKMRKLRVVGIAGSDEKCKYLMETLKFDEVVNYKSCGDLQAALKSACPNGIDCYFENVGGPTLDAILTLCNRGARIAACGMISQYNVSGEPYGVKNMEKIIAREIKLQGFIVSSMLKKYGAGEAAQELAFGLMNKNIVYKEDIIDGPIQDAPSVFLRMLRGENFGKQLLRVKG